MCAGWYDEGVKMGIRSSKWTVHDNSLLYLCLGDSTICFTNFGPAVRSIVSPGCDLKYIPSFDITLITP